MRDPSAFIQQHRGAPDDDAGRKLGEKQTSNAQRSTPNVQHPTVRLQGRRRNAGGGNLSLLVCDWAVSVVTTISSRKIAPMT